MANPSPSQMIDLAGLLQAGADGDPWSDAPPSRTPLTAMLAHNPHGRGWIPPEDPRAMPRFTEEARSSQHPWSDYLAEKISPTAGHAFEAALKFGKASGNALAGAVGAPLVNWGAGKVDALSSDLADMLENAPSLTSSAAAEDKAIKPAEADPLQPLRDRAATLSKQANDALARREANRPKNRAPYPEKDLKFFDADRDYGNANTELEKVNNSLETQGAAANEKLREELAASKRREDTERIKNLEKDVSIPEQIWRNDSQALGLGLGALAGHAVRAGLPFLSRLPYVGDWLGSYGGIVGRYNTWSANRAREANRIMNRKVPPSDWAGRVARVNEFFARGGSEDPFLRDPGQVPPYRSNPNALPTGQLYRPPVRGNYATDAAIPAAGLAESGLAHYFYLGPAEEEMHKAQEAVDHDPNEINIKRWQAARTNLATAKAVDMGGRGFAGGYGLGALLHRRQDVFPRTQPAERERAIIDYWLTRHQGGGGRGGQGGPPLLPPVRNTPLLPGPGATGSSALPPPGPGGPGSPSSAALLGGLAPSLSSRLQQDELADELDENEIRRRR